jgi:CheY-like chemotaxis protein
VPKTLLAVDDSATMRKVLEITFAGEDFRVVTADASASALARMSEEPVAAVIDTSLGADDGYAVAKAVRSRDARVAVVLLSSRYMPYDANRGRDAGVDDYIDKPFDTQALIEKVKKAIVARENVKAAPAPTTERHGTSPFGSPQRPAASPPAPSVAAKPAWPSRNQTISFEGTPPAPPPPAPAASFSRPVAPPAPAPVVQPAAPTRAPVPVAPAPSPATAHTLPTAPPRVEPARAPAAAAAASATTGNGQLAGKLGELGLSAQQVDAVLALSREVVERVVWEVVPQLAETMIKEEIARLTKE